MAKATRSLAALDSSPLMTHAPLERHATSKKSEEPDAMADTHRIDLGSHGLHAAAGGSGAAPGPWLTNTKL